MIRYLVLFFIIIMWYLIFTLTITQSTSHISTQYFIVFRVSSLKVLWKSKKLKLPFPFSGKLWRYDKKQSLSYLANPSSKLTIEILNWCNGCVQPLNKRQAIGFILLRWQRKSDFNQMYKLCTHQCVFINI